MFGECFDGAGYGIFWAIGIKGMHGYDYNVARVMVRGKCFKEISW